MREMIVPQGLPNAPFPNPPNTATDRSPRQRWMGLLARADAHTLQAGVDRLEAAIGPLPAHTLLRGPEAGLVMVRGRAGATGDGFNLGEMTVTRCSVRLLDGAGVTGHAYVRGRDPGKARSAAVVDALMLGSRHAVAIEATVLTPLEQVEIARRRTLAAKSAATRVDFFTMVRSEHGGRD